MYMENTRLFVVGVVVVVVVCLFVIMIMMIHIDLYSTLVTG
jgi:hypothetical protein